MVKVEATMNKRLEKLQMKIENGEPVIGIFVMLADSSSSEIAAYAGCDFVWIDAEHGMLDRREIYHHVMAVQSAGACAFVRVPGVDHYQVKHILDVGPDGIIFPFINTSELARQAVEATTYPADGGKRGIGPLRAIKYGLDDEADYIKNSVNDIWRILQIESMEAVENIDRILDVNGYQSLFIGPADLKMSMLDVSADEKDEKVEQITETVGEKCKEKGVFLGSCTAPEKDSVKNLMEAGCQWMFVAQDIRILSNSIKSMLNTIKG